MHTQRRRHNPPLQRRMARPAKLFTALNLLVLHVDFPMYFNIYRVEPYIHTIGIKGGEKELLTERIK